MVTVSSLAARILGRHRQVSKLWAQVLHATIIPSQDGSVLSGPSHVHSSHNIKPSMCSWHFSNCKSHPRDYSLSHKYIIEIYAFSPESRFPRISYMVRIRTDFYCICFGNISENVVYKLEEKCKWVNVLAYDDVPLGHEASHRLSWLSHSIDLGPLQLKNS